MSSSSAAPPNLPFVKSAISRSGKLILAGSLAIALFFGSLVGLRVSGLLRPFKVPSSAMASAISPGDHLIMEGLTYVFGKPQRGDIVAFKTDNISAFRDHAIIVSRVAGLPGERLRIVGGKLYVGDLPVSLQNAQGEIAYVTLPRTEFMPGDQSVTVPANSYFVLGDNSANAFDSRFWGCVPQEAIIGRMMSCYWPPDRVGGIK